MEALIMGQTKARPGVMIYFELLDALAVLEDAEKGRLFEAILRYARDGEVPEFPPGALAAVWAMTKPRIDLDAERYAERCEKARAAITKRWDDTKEYERILTNTERTNSTTTPTTTSTPTPTSTSSSTAAGTTDRGYGGKEKNPPPYSGPLPENEFEESRQSMLRTLERYNSIR